MKATVLRQIMILPMVLGLTHTGMLGVRPNPDGIPSSSGASVEVVQVEDDIEGRGWLEKVACIACFSAVAIASTGTFGGAAIGGLAMCGMVCYYLLY